MSTRHRFALVLAAGDGTRVRSLTLDAAGVSVPKQFCSLAGSVAGGAKTGDRSLLSTTLARAERIVPRPRITSVVAAQHRQWWQPDLSHLPSGNVVVQPVNRGTAVGILLPLLQILRRDPQATVLVLPSDHFVADEAVLARAAIQAVELAEREPERIVLLGAIPERADPDLGWIVPGTLRGVGVHAVRQFVEKPAPARAAELFADGALWNTFLFAARGVTLVRRFERRLPGLVQALRESLSNQGIGDLYADLAPTDFSGLLLEGAEEALSLIAVPPCGWNDLGTPERIAAQGQRLVPPAARPQTRPRLSLERPEVWRRLQLAF